MEKSYDTHVEIILKDTIKICSWWRHQMETFSPLLALCEGNPSVTSGFPNQRPVTWSFYIFFALRLSKRLSKHPRSRWFDRPWRLVWRHCNVLPNFNKTQQRTNCVNNSGVIIKLSYVYFLFYAIFPISCSSLQALRNTQLLLQHLTGLASSISFSLFYVTNG